MERSDLLRKLIELENEFSEIDISVESIRINQFTVISDIPKFVNSSIEDLREKSLRSNYNFNTCKPCLNLLIEVIEKLK